MPRLGGAGRGEGERKKREEEGTRTRERERKRGRRRVTESGKRQTVWKKVTWDEERRPG